LGFDITSTALAEREFRLAATDADLNLRDRNALERETQFALDVQATQLDLLNAAALLDLTATQSDRNIIATVTANAAESARQRTQIALDYEATQVQLQQNATQVQLDFQQTRAALGEQDSSFESQAVVANSTIPASPTITALLPTPTSTVMLPPPSDTPTATASRMNIETDFSDGIASRYWLRPDGNMANVWKQTPRGLEAVMNGAEMISSMAWDEYTLTVDIAPAIVLESTYTILLQFDAPQVLAVEIETSGLAADNVRLVELIAAEGEVTHTYTESRRLAVYSDIALPLTSDTRFVAIVNANTVTVRLNDSEILVADLPDNFSTGQVGVILPQGATLQSIVLHED
jgi:hypothetical protein